MDNAGAVRVGITANQEDPVITPGRLVPVAMQCDREARGDTEGVAEIGGSWDRQASRAVDVSDQLGLRADGLRRPPLVPFEQSAEELPRRHARRDQLDRFDLVRSRRR